MNCNKVQSLMSAYLDSELPGVEMLDVRQHVSNCQECGPEFEALLRIKRAFGGMKPQSPAPDLAERICMRLDQVPDPAHGRIFAKARKHITVFPSRMRLAAVGMGVFAMLLLLRAGEITPVSNPYISLTPVTNATEVTPNRLLPESWTAEASSLNSVSFVSPPMESWEILNEIGRSSTISGGSPSLLHTSY